MLSYSFIHKNGFLSNQGVDLKFLIVVTQGVFACSVADSLCKTDDVLL